MIQLVYVSAADPWFTDAQITDILSTSRRNNARDSITGMLLYKGGSVIQVLEGGEEEVRRLFGAIRKDRRHHHVTLIYEIPIHHRDFEGWAMGFRLLDTTLNSPPEGAEEILKLITKAASQSPGRARRLLTTFDQSIR